MATTTDPSYRPENVRIEHHPEGCYYGPSYQYLLIDFDGTELQWFADRAEAESRRRNRAAVIKAALTRRANKRR